jgi:hypothetical protein
VLLNVLEEDVEPAQHPDVLLISPPFIPTSFLCLVFAALHAAALLKPVLLRLGPVLLNILENFDPAQHPDVLPGDIDAATSCYTSTVAVAAFAGGPGSSLSVAVAAMCFLCARLFRAAPAAAVLADGLGT